MSRTTALKVSTNHTPYVALTDRGAHFPTRGSGDGITDDTAAIQRAMVDGGRCGANCGGSTIHPATLYFPSGTYIISSSIIMYYNTEMLGNVSPSGFVSEPGLPHAVLIRLILKLAH